MTEARPVPPAAQPVFIKGLAGLRGLAALGVLLTHVAFQTGAADASYLGRLLSRFDMAVALFFGLSGFLLWRAHARAAWGGLPAPGPARYLRHRAVRILPAYWAVVCAVLLLLPEAGDGWRVWLANLGLVQIFVPLTLTNGMTQMWSLSVEVAFYLVLPVFAAACCWLRGSLARWRAPVLVALGVLALGWAFIPVSTPDGIHSDNWLPGYLPWFLAGMVLAELAAAASPLLGLLAQRHWLCLLTAVAAFALSATDLAGPAGLTRGQPWQYAVKIALGAVLAFTILAPVVGGAGQRWLESPAALTLGRWSYGIFLWHLVVLWAIFPVFGIIPFSGHFLFVLTLTAVLSIAVGAASYALVEEPARAWLARREAGKAARPTAATAISAGS